MRMGRRGEWLPPKKQPRLSMIERFRPTRVTGAVFVGLIVAGYWFQWGWTGFPTKTLWDWLGVLAIPAVVALGAAWYTAQQGRVSARENTDNQREASLQAYIDKMSELLLMNDLRKSIEDDCEVRKIARVRTLTVLRGLDPIRKASVLQFLYESGLIDKTKHIIDLNGADLRGANLNFAKLRNADLRGANLTGADLIYAELIGADLRDANLRNADLRNADLHSALLSEADMGDADLSEANVKDTDLHMAYYVSHEQHSKVRSS